MEVKVMEIDKSFEKMRIPPGRDSSVLVAISNAWSLTYRPKH